MVKISIVGGGISGLAAAYYLSDREDFDITILESSDRLGGRLLTSYEREEISELGGFITFPWYKYTQQIIKHLRLDSSLSYINNSTELFWSDAQKGFNVYDTTPMKSTFMKSLYKKPSLIKALDSKYFYEPLTINEDYGSAYELLKQLTNGNADELEKLEELVRGYCYGDPRQLPANLYLGFFAQFIRHSGFKKGLLIDGGISKFISAIEKYLKVRGVNIKLNSTVEGIEKGKITLSDEVINSDIIIQASGPPKDITDYSYTKYLSISGTISRPFDTRWMAAYVPKTNNQDFSLVSFAQARDISKSDNQHQFIACMINEAADEHIKDDQLIAILQPQLREYFPGIEVDCIIDKKLWDKTMPIVGQDTVAKINSMQGKDNVFYVGDYFSTPCIETAVYSAKKVSDYLMSSV